MVNFLRRGVEVKSRRGAEPLVRAPANARGSRRRIVSGGVKMVEAKGAESVRCIGRRNGDPSGDEIPAFGVIGMAHLAAPSALNDHVLAVRVLG